LGAAIDAGGDEYIFIPLPICIMQQPTAFIQNYSIFEGLS